jgi:hypothetical protein
MFTGGWKNTWNASTGLAARYCATRVFGFSFVERAWSGIKTKAVIA